MAAWAQPANLEREIDAGVTHTHTFRAGAGQFVLITAHQLDGNVDIMLRAPGESLPVESNRSYNGGFERLTWISPSGGEFKLEIVRPDKTGARYRLEIEIRAATELDRTRASAYRTVFAEVPALKKKQTAAASREVVTKLMEAAARAQQSDDLELAGFAFQLLAQAHDRMGDRGKAFETIQRAIAIRKDLPHERHGWINSTIHMGIYQSSAGSADAALATLQRALALIRAENGKEVDNEMLALNGLAIVSSRLGRYDDTLRYNQQLLPLAKERGTKGDTATILSNIGTAHANLGDSQASIEAHAEALRIRREVGDDRRTAVSLRSIGRSYTGVNEYTKAAVYLQEAAALYKKTGDRLGQSEVAMLLGDLHGNDADPAVAIQHYEAATALQREGKLLTLLTSALGYLGELYARAGRWELAKAAADEISALRASTKSLSDAPRHEVLLARIAEHESRFGDAEAHFERAVSIARTLKRIESEAASVSARSAYFARRGDLHAAIADKERAIAIAETAAGRIAAGETRTAYRASRAQRTVDLIDLLMTLHEREPEGGYAARAYYAAERVRGRSLAEMIAQPMRRAASPEEARLLDAVTAAQAKLFREGVQAAERKRLDAELTKAEFALDLQQRTSNTKAQTELFETWTEERTRAELAGADGAVITYSLGSKRTFAWVHTKEVAQAVTLPPRAAIEAAVEAFRRLLAKPASALTASRDAAAWTAQSKKLHESLIAPLSAAIKGKTRLLIVPDGVLGQLPFEAIGGLIETHRITYAPSASIAGALRKPAPAPRRTLLAMGDPVLPGSKAMAPVLERGYSFAPLPNARAEVATLGKLFPGGAMYVGEQASEERMKKEEAGSYRYLHFAAHGYFDGANPERSGIVLAPGGSDDGFLQAREISNFEMNADLVTLSACQSGLGKVLDGEGVQGLSRAFFLAGARSVIVSLWNVNDGATGELMRQFYIGLKAGLAKDEALRAAKLAVRRQPRWRHPYYWAPFVLQGDRGGR